MAQSPSRTEFPGTGCDPEWVAPALRCQMLHCPSTSAPGCPANRVTCEVSVFTALKWTLGLTHKAAVRVQRVGFSFWGALKPWAQHFRSVTVRFSIRA